MEFFTGGGCGGNCASAAGPATSRTAIVTTVMRSILPPEGIRPVFVVAKLSHNFPAAVSARVVTGNLFWAPEADLLHAGETCGMGVERGNRCVPKLVLLRLVAFSQKLCRNEISSIFRIPKLCICQEMRNTKPDSRE